MVVEKFQLDRSLFIKKTTLHWFVFLYLDIYYEVNHNKVMIKSSFHYTTFFP